MKNWSKTISFRLPTNDEIKFREMYKKAGKKPSTFAREIVQRYLNEQTVSV